MKVQGHGWKASSVASSCHVIQEVLREAGGPRSTADNVTGVKQATVDACGFLMLWRTKTSVVTSGKMGSGKLRFFHFLKFRLNRARLQACTHGQALLRRFTHRRQFVAIIMQFPC